LGRKLSALRSVSTVGSVLTPIIDNRFVPYPYLMTFVVTRRCNSRCQMCLIWKEKDSPYLSLDQIERIFSQNDFSFLRSITFTGGEPTLRADLPELFSIVLRSTPAAEHVLLATSGLNTRRTVEYVTQMLKTVEDNYPRLRRFDVQISLDGIGEVHDTVRGISGFFGRVQDSLGGLREVQKHFPRLNVLLSCVLMPYNLPHVGSLREFARKESLEIRYSPVVISETYYNNLHGVGSLNFPEAGEPSARELFERLGEEDRSSIRFYYRDMAGMVQGRPRRRRCMMGFFGFVLEHDGDVYPCVNCENTSFGSLLSEPFERVWFGEKAEAARVQLRAACCPTCTSMCYTQPVSALEVAEIKWLRWQHRIHSWFSKGSSRR
jgi:radical SAM protein with 4Fe4S-binding SPASM domain